LNNKVLFQEWLGQFLIELRVQVRILSFKLKFL
jgi:hypothetical protein